MKKQPPETLERLCKHAVGICTITFGKSAVWNQMYPVHTL